MTQPTQRDLVAEYFAGFRTSDHAFRDGLIARVDSYVVPLP
jgi:hypothetical protein